MLSQKVTHKNENFEIITNVSKEERAELIHNDGFRGIRRDDWDEYNDDPEWSAAQYEIEAAIKAGLENGTKFYVKF